MTKMIYCKKWRKESNKWLSQFQTDHIIWPKLKAKALELHGESISLSSGKMIFHTGEHITGITWNADGRKLEHISVALSYQDRIT